MTTIRVSDENAQKLRFYGKTYEESVKALLDTVEKQKGIDYDKIRGIVSDELAKVAH